MTDLLSVHKLTRNGELTILPEKRLFYFTSYQLAFFEHTIQSLNGKKIPTGLTHQ